MSDGLGTSTLTYDTAGRLTDVSGPFANDTVHYSYDTLNRRAGTTINGGYGTSYGYDALSRLQSITSAAGTFNYSYVGNTQLLQSLSMPNGTQTGYSYDGLERLTQVQSTFTGSGANLSHYTYGYDTTTFRAGRTGETSQVLNDPIQSIAYSYNSADEINGEAVSIGGTAQSNTSYAYDPMGNRAQVQATSATSTNTQSYVHNKLNQMLSLSNSSGGTSTLGYDAAGNLTNTNNGASNTNYTYDDANRLTAVEVPGNSKSTFLYDGASRLRVSKDFVWQNGSWVQQNEVRRIYDGMDVVQERDANNLPIC